MRSLYIRPGQSCLSEPVLPDFNTLTGYPNQLLNPYSEQWTLRRRAAAARRLGAERGLRRIAHAAHQPAAGRRSALAVRPHRAGPDPHRAGGQLHASLLDLVVQPARHDLQPGAATNPQPPYSVIQSDVNNGYAYYDALESI